VDLNLVFVDYLGSSQRVAFIPGQISPYPIWGVLLYSGCAFGRRRKI